MYEWDDSNSDPLDYNVMNAVSVLLFRTPSREIQLSRALNTINPKSAIKKLFLRENEKTVQELLAPELRAATIRHMRTSLSPMMVEFRKEYKKIHSQSQEVLQKDLPSFLQHSAVSQNWATDVHANALGNLFNVNVLVTTMNGAIPLKTFIIHSSSVSSAPTIHLYNDRDVHWYIDPSRRDSTLGDGNCLYNAFAQALQQQALLEMNKKTSQVASSLSSTTTYLKQIEQAKYLSMKALVKHIKDANSEIDQCEEDKLTHAILAEVEATQSAKIEVVAKKKNHLSEETPLKLTPAFKKAMRKRTPEHYRFIPKFYDDAPARDFYQVLTDLHLRASELTGRIRFERKVAAAAGAATQLHFELNKVAILYYNEKKLSSEEFVAACMSQINKVRPELEKHRGWKQILGNIALAVIGLGIGYLIAGAINKKVTGNFLFFRTASALALDEVEEVVQANTSMHPKS
jgi:hypothetical protein